MAEKTALDPLSRTIRRGLGQAVETFSMIRPGDRILLGFSGGKDSLLLARGLAELRRRSPVPFELRGCFVDPTGGSFDAAPLRALAERLELPLQTRPYPIFPLLEERQEPHPCSLCAHLRRGLLASCAREEGCNVLALGHHLDDALETTLLNLCHAGRFRCFSPHMVMSRTGLRVIRPLVFLEERTVTAEVARMGVQPCAPPCPFGAETRRAGMKKLLEDLRGSIPEIKGNLLHALRSHPTPDGWEDPPSCPMEPTPKGDRSPCRTRKP